MQNRKSFKADLENKKGLFLQIGLVLALASVWTAFEWKTYKDGPGSLGDLEMTMDDEEVLVTQRNTPPPPPPPPAPPEVLNIVEDDKVDIDELKMAATEISDDDVFELREVDVDDGEVFNFVNVENKPVFPGCEDLATEDERFNCFNTKIRQFVGKKFEFPEMAKQMGIQGKVWVSFIIEKDGKVSDITIERGVDKLLDDESLRVVNMLPKMIPAKVGGRSVRMRYSLPINAKLQ
ncbi:MAG: energy transducer TonB [Cryomorphaceae bacterium]|nr:energy transducer TonB [Cryomorphaceae bacterium]